MRISDWSSDVCSSDLEQPAPPADPHAEVLRLRKAIEAEPDKDELRLDLALALLQTGAAAEAGQLIDALPANLATDDRTIRARARRSEEHTSELQSLMRISYAVFCLKKKTNKQTPNPPQ